MVIVSSKVAPDDAPDWCFDMNEDLVMSTCTWTGQKWVKSYDDGFAGGGGDPAAAFGPLIVLGILVAVGVTLWRVSLARRVARDAGLDPDRATELALLEDHGLEASYLSAHLRPARAAAVTQEPTGTVRSTEDRLRELRSLLESGLISQEEHDARRTVVLDAL